jgi:soluble lytic murein transglycosylase-like protein
VDQLYPRGPSSHRPQELLVRLRTSRNLTTFALLAASLVACAEREPDGAAAPTPEATPTEIEAPEVAPSPRLVTVPEHAREAEESGGDPLAPAHFDDPSELAEQLLAAEEAIRDPATPEEDIASWGWTQQQAYRDLAVNADWADPVREALPDELHDAFDANLRATVRLREMTEPREDLPAWRIVEPPTEEVLLDAYREAEAEYGVGWEYLAAIHLVETRMGRIDGVSVAGAQGPMQFMPQTWDHWGEGDVNDPHDAIAAAARYLVDHGAPDDMQSAIFAYNRSQNYVDAISLHAAVMRDDEATFHGYYHWRVYYRMPDGDVVLPVGFDGTGG